MDCRQLNELNEVEAWKTMMDSMIKFIHASTKLMNTYNKKASNQLLPSLCELVCPPCVESQKKTVRQCSAIVAQNQATAARSPQQSPRNPTPDYFPSNSTPGEYVTAPEGDETPILESTRQDEGPIVESTRIGEVPPTPITEDTVPEGDETPIIESTRIGEVPPTPINEDMVPEGDGTPIIESTRIGEVPPTPITEGTVPEGDGSPIIESTRIGEAPPTPINEDTLPGSYGTPIIGSTRIGEVPPTPINQSTVSGDRSPIIASTRIGEVPATPVPKSAESAKKAGGDLCVCKEVNEIKNIISQVGVAPDAKDTDKKCGCGAKKSKPQLCACPVTSKETANLTESMVQKLEKAQGEIDELKKELQKLQFMEATRRSNSAALYREIMKETPLDKGPTSRNSTPVRRTSAPQTPTDTCPTGCTPAQSRRPPNATLPPIRSNNPTISFAQTPNTRSTGQTVCRPPPSVSPQRTSPMMQPLAASTYIGDAGSTNAASRWSQQTPSRQATGSPYFQSLASPLATGGSSGYYRDVQSPTRSGTSQPYYEDSGNYCPAYTSNYTNDPSRFSPVANSTSVQGPTQSGTSQRYYDDSSTYCPTYCSSYTNDPSRFSPVANSTSVYQQGQYGEVECVFKRPKKTPDDLNKGFLSPPRTDLYSASPNLASGYQGSMQTPRPPCPSRTYPGSTGYQDIRIPYDTHEYDDQLCDDYTCGNDECENR